MSILIFGGDIAGYDDVTLEGRIDIPIYSDVGLVPEVDIALMVMSIL